MATIAIVGHSNQSIAKFRSQLMIGGITHIVDVRSRPRSRFMPHFNKKRLEDALLQDDIEYEWQGEHLGGFANADPLARPTLDSLAEKANLHPTFTIALMCAERAPQKCHRFCWLGNYLVKAHDIEIRSLVLGQADWWPQAADFPDLPSWLALDR